MEDALQVIAQARPAGAAPWRWGAFAAGAIALAVSFAVTGPALFVFELPVADITGQSLGRIILPERVQLTKAEIRKEDEKRLEDLAEDLTEEAKAATDPVVKQFLDELNELIRALQEGRITPEEAAARMAALEKALEDWKEQNQKGAEDVEKRLQEAAEKQKKAHDALKPLLDAMRERDWDEAAKKLDELAKKLEKKELPKKDQEKIAKDLEQLAKALENERQKDKERLQKERDRLKEKQEREKDRFAQKDRDRLKDTERQLEQLDDPQQQQDQSDPERQLERLSDELDDAARDMLRRLAEELRQAQQEQGEQGPESEQRRQQEGQQGDDGQGGQQGEMTAEDIKRAADALRRMAQNGKGRQQMRIAQGRMIDVREMMKRGQNGQSGKGQNGEGQDGENGESGEGQEAGGDAEKQFEEGANGQLGQGMKPGGKGGDMLLLGGPKGQGMKLPGMGPGQGNDPQLGQGDGIGEGHDPNLMGGEKPSMDFKTDEDFVPGQHGEDGQTKEKVVMTAAQKGFASRAYREVHQDYAGVVEDALEKEHIPPGKRTYVRRYFDLIRPR